MAEALSRLIPNADGRVMLVIRHPHSKTFMTSPSNLDAASRQQCHLLVSPHTRSESEKAKHQRRNPEWKTSQKPSLGERHGGGKSMLREFALGTIKHSMRTRIIAATVLAFMFPAVLFMTSLLLRSLLSPQHEPARSAQQLIMWYAGRTWTLWVLLLSPCCW
jgi:hypothetical protein